MSVKGVVKRTLYGALALESVFALSVIKASIRLSFQTKAIF
jgi:hypothetical protein